MTYGTVRWILLLSSSFLPSHYIARALNISSYKYTFISFILHRQTRGEQKKGKKERIGNGKNRRKNVMLYARTRTTECTLNLTRVNNIVWWAFKIYSNSVGISLINFFVCVWILSLSINFCVKRLHFKAFFIHTIFCIQYYFNLQVYPFQRETI